MDDDCVRVSKRDPNPDLQRHKFEVARCERIIGERVASREQTRPQLATTLDSTAERTTSW